MTEKHRCRKKRFRDHDQATQALRRINGNPSLNKPKHPQRAYQCPQCQGWHLTSMSLNDHFAKDHPDYIQDYTEPA